MTKKFTATKIADNQSLVSVTNAYGRQINIYDDGYGPLWVYRTAGGIDGVVRTESYEDAYEIVLDEILKPISQEEFNTLVDNNELLDDDSNLCEGYAYQANATGTGIVSIDLNGEYLELLTDELTTALNWVVVIENDDED